MNKYITLSYDRYLAMRKNGNTPVQDRKVQDLKAAMSSALQWEDGKYAVDIYTKALDGIKPTGPQFVNSLQTGRRTPPPKRRKRQQHEVQPNTPPVMHSIHGKKIPTEKQGIGAKTVRTMTPAVRTITLPPRPPADDMFTKKKKKQETVGRWLKI